jgi:2'-5' RNA ligase
MHPPGGLRVFTGLPLPVDVVRRLADPCAALRRSFPNLRVVRPEGLHVTLEFLGELPEERVREIAGRLAALEEPSLAVARIRTVLGGLGQFPPAGAPRVLYCPLGAGSEAVSALYAQVCALLDGRGGRDAGRAYTPHVTVARSKGGFLDMAAARELFAFEIPVELDRIVLFQSVLGRQGAEYRPLKSVMFR